MRQNRKQILTLIRLLAVFWLGWAAPAVAASLVTAIVTDPLTGVALEGYDPVSYFTETEPVPGVPDYSYEWQGVPWYFASAANRDVFMRNPGVYAPQFGGHCLVGVSRGYLSDGKPRLFAISGAKLYLFYSVANREAFFSAPEPAIAAAETNWQSLAKTLAGPQAGMADAIGAVPADPAP